MGFLRSISINRISWEQLDEAEGDMETTSTSRHAYYHPLGEHVVSVQMLCNGFPPR